MNDLAAFELSARKAKLAQIQASQALDDERMAEIAGVDADRKIRAGEALGYLEAFRLTGDAEAFASEMEHWCRRPGFHGFVGPNGQMFLKQLLKAGPAGEGARILQEALVAPGSDEEAHAALSRVLAFIDGVKQGGHPAPARTPFLLSFFWALEDPQTWPVAWSSATKSTFNLGWTQPGHDHAENYLEFAHLIRSLGDPIQLAHALFWFDKHRFVGLAPSLIGRCEHAWALAREGRIARYPTEEERLAAQWNSIALIYEVWTALSGLRDGLADALRAPGKLAFAKVKSGDHLYRWWGWASYTPEGGNASIRIWVTREGVLVGLHPGWAKSGWYAEAGEVAARSLPNGFEIFQIWDGDGGSVRSIGSDAPANEFLVGRFFEGTRALDDLAFGGEVIDIAGQLRPLLEELRALAKSSPASDAGKSEEPVTDAAPDDIAALVAEFKRVRGYPTPKDEQNQGHREAWAALLTPDELEIADLNVLRQIINTGKYGGPGPQSVLNATLGGLDADGLEAFYRSLIDLLWGDEDLAERIDRALDPEVGWKGLGESVIMKLLAIVHPERVIPVFPFKGDMGKAKLMQLIGLSPPAAELSRGEKQVRANDTIRASLEPHLPRDPWAQAQFLYWLRTRPAPSAGAEANDPDAVAALASDLYLPIEVVQAWVDLLREKGQIIFYGPPGTGKTYVAQRLARLVAGDVGRQRLVQFHPSTSYEDFFEGYRPETNAEGALGYRLVPGPLARMAEQASDAPGVDHVMVIDEINRANLPKVLGELLFLLEYRDEQIQTLYRPDDPFELPANLYFIGTMNTADKSIALIDAALRRRFHFIPFFPHEEPHNTVLAQWLDDNNPDAAWVAGLVEHVNERLMKQLGGPHLQIGPSHFFDRSLDEAKVRRIWQYSVLPFIEDQLWGQHDLLGSYGFDRVLADYQRAGGDAPSESSSETTTDAGDRPRDRVEHPPQPDAGS